MSIENEKILPFKEKERGVQFIHVGVAGAGHTHALYLAEHIAMMKESHQPIIIVDDIKDFGNRSDMSLKVRIGNSGLEALSMQETFQIRNYHCMNKLNDDFFDKNDGTIVNEAKMRASCLKAKKARLKRKKNKRK
jgi:hypothetical protein